MSDLALSLGYTSESAFSDAFKRRIGIAPKRYPGCGPDRVQGQIGTEVRSDRSK
jgi:AraC-like DNA-binding protein